MRRNNKDNSAVTLKDIAQATGFSINTVSRSLARKSDISEATQEIIRAKAQEMGYIANALASFLRSGISKTVSIIVGDISNPHFAIMVKEMQTLFHRRGYTCAIYNTEEKADIELQAITASISQNADGIIICPSPSGKENIGILQQHKKPFVLLGRHFSEMAVNHVVCDDNKGGYTATKHLIANGHRDILFLNGPRGISSARERLSGYQQALTESGISYRHGMVCTVPVLGDEEKTEKVLTDRKDFTAILGFSDLVAWKAICHLTKRGLKIPEDCSVIGFDNVHFAYPTKLTSISSSKTTMAKKASELLLKMMNSSEPIHESVVLDTRLIEGETVRSR